METCRTCAKCDFDNETQWFDLFNAPRWQLETERIHLVLSTWKIKISCNDGLPQKICTDCFSKFCTVSSFRLQCLEAQTILSNIFDKIDTQSIQDEEVFEGFANEQDNDVKTAKTQSVGEAATSAAEVLLTVHLKSIEHTLEATTEKSITSSNSSSNNKNNNSNNNNENIATFSEILNINPNDNTEVSFRTTTKLSNTAVLENENKNQNFNHILVEDHEEEDINNNTNYNNNISNNTSNEGVELISSNNLSNNSNDNERTLLTENTNDLDDNDLIEELIEELDIIEEITEEEHQAALEEEEEGEEDLDEFEHNEENIPTTSNITMTLDQEGDDPLENDLKITFECKYCYKWKNNATENFLTQQDLLAHITKLHSSDQPYNCPYCQQMFMDAASRTTHLKDEHSQKVYECQTCGKKYADKFNLKNHVEKYHSGTDFDCTLCAKSFCSSKSLNYHMKWHNPEEQLKCSYCDRLFINQRHLKCHEETHTGYRSQEVCSFCGKNFFHLKTLRWHIYRQHGGEKPYKCARCTEVFTSYFEKRLHMLENHLDNLTLIEKTECMLCHKRYEHELELKDHMLEDHKENKGAVKISNNKRVIMNKKPKSFTGIFQCEKCDKRFNMKSALERHMAVHSTEGRPHACPQCPKRFKRSQDMKWHLKTHSSEKPNICDVCGKGFALKYVLTQHRRSHEVLEKNFTCTTCGRSYLFEKSLRLHERIHSGKTYYKCDLCSESFVTHIKFKCKCVCVFLDYLID
ncbi:zinc finger protein 823 [Lucilia cuprina]|uniref:zinc finger protein 823 n=1 Tax=Lucilia cuprina TaxID=7375 RepID=UPI001F05FD53|nr:zinc finger protein 823 [Lucilia cuprina]